VHFVVEAVLAGTGALAPIAGTIDVTQDMTATSACGNDAVEELVSRAHRLGVLRADVNAVDITLLIEQLGRSPLVELVTKQGRSELLDAAEHARRRIVGVALDGLRAPAPAPLPDPAPGWELLAKRWRPIGASTS
jgi:hypothetical protein